jgi:Fur family ferric uptake transcriptional regulator
MEIEAILDQLRDAGLRITESRRVIVSALIEQAEHLTTDALVDDVRGHHPEASRATVYRTIAVMDSLGLLEHHGLGPGPASYHLSGRDHRHLVCEVCGSVISVPASLFDGLSEDLRTYGFEVGEHRATVAGKCARCAAATRSGN